MLTNKCKIKEYPLQERPRERMEMLGAAQLTDRELLAVLLATGSREGSALNLADQLLLEVNGLQNMRESTLDELMKPKGIGMAKASTIAAAIELGRRIWASGNDYRPYIDRPSDAAEILMGKMRGLDREHFMAMLLNNKKQMISIEIISIGSLDRAMAHPREVFKPAIKRSASSILLAHNHPSGHCEPSREDILVTERMREVGRIVGIDVIDHIIIGEDTYYSFRENQMF